MMAIIVLLIILVGVSGFSIVGPGMIEKSMNKVLAHPPYKISQAAQKAALSVSATGMVRYATSVRRES
jgi:hypothetical protein